MRKRASGILILVVLVAAAFLLRLTEPTDADLHGPFVTYAHVGEAAEGRNLTWKADEVYLADRLTSSTWVGETDGVWLVIEGTIGSRLELSTPDVSVLVGERRYTASNRPKDAALGAPVAAGLPQSGAFVFELPRSVLESEAGTHATARFATGFRVRLDSAIDMVLDLSALEHRQTAALPPPGVVTS